MRSWGWARWPRYVATTEAHATCMSVLCSAAGEVSIWLLRNAVDVVNEYSPSHMHRFASVAGDVPIVPDPCVIELGSTLVQSHSSFDASRTLVPLRLYLMLVRRI